MVLRRLFSKAEKPSIPEGERIYAIGDIHGRLDLTLKALDEIHRHNDSRVGSEVIFLGDYIDRGPDSAGVVEAITTDERLKEFRTTFLKGNHEATLLDFLEDAGVGPSWSQFGGQDALISYGVQPPLSKTDIDAWEECRQAFRDALPIEHKAFYAGLSLSAERGDYLFVHAGVDPNKPLSKQTEADYLWSREAFMTDGRRLDKVIVHGHTPEAKAHKDKRRVGLDTGAYQTGRLSVAYFEGEAVHFWST